MYWSIIILITTILTLVNHVYADPATLDPSVLGNLTFDHIDGDIGFIKVLSCTESTDNSTFTYPLGISKMAELEPYVISMKIVSEDKPVENITIGIDDYAVQTVTCSNPVISITKSIEPSLTVNYPNLTSISPANLDNYLGSDIAKWRVSWIQCEPINWDHRSIRNYQYFACGNNEGIHIQSAGRRCVWEWDTGKVRPDESIAIYYGFDVNRQKVCAESGGLGPGDGSFYNLDTCVKNDTCPDTGNLCTENICIDGDCVTTNTIICEFGQVCNASNGECDLTDCNVFDIDKYTEACSVNDVVGRIEALEMENLELQNEIDTLKIEDSALQDEIDTLEIENSELQNEIITLQGEIDTLKTENSGLQDDIRTLNATIKAINDRIDNLVIQPPPPPPPPKSATP